MKRFEIREHTHEYFIDIRLFADCPPEIVKHLYRCSEMLASHFLSETAPKDNK